MGRKSQRAKFRPGLTFGELRITYNELNGRLDEETGRKTYCWTGVILISLRNFL